MSKNIYDLMKGWFDFCYENPEKINSNHSALYFFILSHSNRMGWKQKFGLPTTMSMEAIGIKSYNTYIKTFRDLEKFGAIKVIENSKNQYSSNIIALSNFDKALDKALDKATLKHLTKQHVKQSESTIQSNDSIIIPIQENTNTKSTNTPIQEDSSKINFDMLLKTFNEIFSKKCSVLSLATKTKFKARIKEGWTKSDIHLAMIEVSKDEYHVGTNYKYATLEYFSRGSTLEKHAVKSTSVSTKGKIGDEDYMRRLESM